MTAPTMISAYSYFRPNMSWMSEPEPTIWAIV